MKEYNHSKIEKKWQTIWDKKQTYKAQEKSQKPKYYGLIEFPYPSGDGLHVGHPRPYIGMDIISRKRRMEGFNVLYPIGWDAFGLPTENYAIKTGKDPRVVTKQNSDTFRRQIKSLGISFDWSREINTTDPKYYKWTQWIFLQFLKKDLAYKAKMTINWCSKDKIGLANEEVVGGCCERCGTPVEKREKEQWMLAITKYADRLYKDLDNVDYLPQIKLGQRNWIGKSEGAEIEFRVNSGVGHPELPGVQHPNSVKVFTTRPDTIFGATYLVLSPEHSLVQELKSQISNWDEVQKYITLTNKKAEVDRTAENKQKTGVELKGIKAINPATKKEIPIWIADYVLSTYGTGAIMAVPAHDERDFTFATKYKLEIKQVVAHIVHPDQYAVKDGVPFEDRDAVMCIVKHWEKNEFLCQEWKDFSEVRTFISGGIEPGEDVISAGTREIKEESGYLNPKFIKQLDGFSYLEFFHRRKKVNRRARFRYLYYELQDGTKVDISKEEDNQHKIVWKKPSEVVDFLNIGEKERIWELFNGKTAEVFTGFGYLVNSDKFDGLDSEKAKKEIIKFVGGKAKTTFKLRDWVFSRQRYWGEPIPVIHCDKCGAVPVPDKDLPVELPKLTGKMKNYKPTDSGESPLANISKWVNVKCPKCKGQAQRETDTMPNWAGSSWYYLRYTDPKNNKEFASEKNLKYWTPVDWYNGGNEHTTLHLLYSRFWHKFLFDLKLVPTNEPYMKRTSHGMILGEGGVKMSKSLGNVINPDQIVKTYGADTLRLYEMFMGPFDQSVAWSTDSMIGPRRFLERIWNLQYKIQKNKKYDELEIEKTIKKVTEDIETMKFNTAISSLMIFINEVGKLDSISQDMYEKFLKLLSPFAPHITEELWQILGYKNSIHLSPWPKWDENLIKDKEVKIAVQINGKVRTEVMIQADETEADIKKNIIKNVIVLRHLGDRGIKKIIYVKNRLINIVIV